jgi:Flp pilus assembly protein TadG
MSNRSLAMPSPRRTKIAARPQHGQILVVFVLGLFAALAMVALIIEAGNVFAQQRIAQNGSDSAATAGTIIVAEELSGKTRTDQEVFTAVKDAADANELNAYTAEYTDDTGTPIGAAVQDVDQQIPADARGVNVIGSRTTGTTFANLLGITSLTATADATVVAGALSGECVSEDSGCTLLPVAFPVKIFECDGGGNLLTGQWVGAPPPGNEGEGYWPIVGAEDLPGGTNPGPDGLTSNGNESTEAILPLCRGAGGSSGAFGWLDLEPGMNLAQEITGPLNTKIDLPDWFQTQAGNPNSVEDELLAYWHQPVLIPLYNQACREDPGDTDICPNPGVDPVGNNTWYYVHTLAVFYIDQVLVQGSNVNQCAAPPGSPLVPVTTGAGFLGCLKGWFVNYVTAGPIVPGGYDPDKHQPIGIQLIR